VTAKKVPGGWKLYNDSVVTDLYEARGGKDAGQPPILMEGSNERQPLAGNETMEVENTGEEEEGSAAVKKGEAERTDRENRSKASDKEQGRHDRNDDSKSKGNIGKKGTNVMVQKDRRKEAEEIVEALASFKIKQSGNRENMQREEESQP